MHIDTLKHTLKRTASLTAGAAVLATLAACASQPSQPVYYPSTPVSTYPSTPANTQVAYIEYGRVTNIETFRTQEEGRPSGAGALIGGIAGAVLGNQIGGGSGRAAATAIGAVGGAVAGNTVERRNKSESRDVNRISVQVDNGQFRTYEVDTAQNLRIGDRVRIENGQLFRS